MNPSIKYSIVGKHFCLFCQLSKDDIGKPPHARGETVPRTLATLDQNLETFENQYDGDIKKAKLCYNVISERNFNIPISQVYNIYDFVKCDIYNRS